MKTVLIRDFREGDFEEIRSIPNERGIERHKDFFEWAKIAKQRETSFTCETESGEVICCFGVNILWDGVGEIWASFTNKLYDYKKEIIIHTGMIIDEIQENLKLVRLQADVLADVPESNRFISHYGFTLESRMRKYNPFGLDVNRYVRIRG